MLLNRDGKSLLVFSKEINMIKISNLFINLMDAYQINEIVSCTHREMFNLNSFDGRIYRALSSIFGAELDDVRIGDQFYAYKLKRRLATRKEKVKLGRLIVRTIPELIPAIRSYPKLRPEELRTCRKLFQCVKAKKRLAKVSLQIS